MRPVMSHENKTQPMIDDFYEYRDLYESDIDAIVSYVDPSSPEDCKHLKNSDPQIGHS